MSQEFSTKELPDPDLSEDEAWELDELDQEWDENCRMVDVLDDVAPAKNQLGRRLSERIEQRIEKRITELVFGDVERPPLEREATEEDPALFDDRQLDDALKLACAQHLDDALKGAVRVFKTPAGSTASTAPTESASVENLLQDQRPHPRTQEGN